MRVSKILLFREKYDITRAELGKACGLSPQRIHMIEMYQPKIRQETVEKLRDGMLIVIQRRNSRIKEFRRDLLKHWDTLSEFVEENDYEL